MNLKVKVVLSPRRRLAVGARADRGITGGNGDMHFGGKAIGSISAHGKPATGIHQVGEIGMDSRELNPVYRRLLIAP